MHKTGWTVFIRLLLVLGMAALILSACKKSSDEEGIEWRKGMYDKLKPNLALPLIGRIQLMPVEELNGMRDHDKSIGIAKTDGYVPHKPTEAERKLIAEYFARLPAAHQRIFNDKLMVIYFLDGFAGAGATDWVMDKEGHPYYYLMLNSEILKKPIDEWLSFKDNGLFDDSSASPSIQVHTGTDYKALMYALLHEGGHMVDYELGMTPHMDPLHRKVSGRNTETTPFTASLWQKIDTPQPAFDFRHRRDVNVYRIFPKKGLIPRAELPAMFSQLSSTPFVSFYAGMTWNEDFADFVTYHYLEHAFGARVRLELVDQGKVISEYRPTHSMWSRQRANLVQALYR